MIVVSIEPQFVHDSLYLCMRLPLLSSTITKLRSTFSLYRLPVGHDLFLFSRWFSLFCLSAVLPPPPSILPRPEQQQPPPAARATPPEAKPRTPEPPARTPEPAAAPNLADMSMQELEDELELDLDELDLDDNLVSWTLAVWAQYMLESVTCCCVISKCSDAYFLCFLIGYGKQTMNEGIDECMIINS